MGRKAFAGAGGGERRLVIACGIAPGEDAPGMIAGPAGELNHPLHVRSWPRVHQVVRNLRDVLTYAVRVQALQRLCDLMMEPLPSTDTGYPIKDALYERVSESKTVAHADQKSLLNARFQRVDQLLFRQLRYFKQR